MKNPAKGTLNYVTNYPRTLKKRGFLMAMHLLGALVLVVSFPIQTVRIIFHPDPEKLVRESNKMSDALVKGATQR